MASSVITTRDFRVFLPTDSLSASAAQGL
jgi:hypothetical protein